MKTRFKIEYACAMLLVFCLAAFAGPPEFNPFQDETPVAVASIAVGEFNPFETTPVATGDFRDVFAVEELRVEPTTIVSIDGENFELDTFIASYYKTPWTHPGRTIEAELMNHGMSANQIAAVPVGKRERLHAAIHEMEKTRTVSKTFRAVAVHASRSGMVCDANGCYYPNTLNRSRTTAFQWSRNVRQSRKAKRKSR